MKWYRVDFYSSGSLHEVEVVRETSKQLVFKSGLRAAKDSAYEKYFKTEKEAVAVLIKRLREVEEARRKQYEYAKKVKKDFEQKYFEKYPDLV